MDRDSIKEYNKNKFSKKQFKEITKEKKDIKKEKEILYRDKKNNKSFDMLNNEITELDKEYKLATIKKGRFI